MEDLEITIHTVLSKISSIFTVVENPHTLRASLSRTRTGSEIKNEIKTGTKTEIKTVRRPRTKTRRTMCDSILVIRITGRINNWDLSRMQRGY